MPSGQPPVESKHLLHIQELVQRMIEEALQDSKCIAWTGPSGEMDEEGRPTSWCPGFYRRPGVGWCCWVMPRALMEEAVIIGNPAYWGADVKEAQGPDIDGLLAAENLQGRFNDEELTEIRKKDPLIRDALKRASGVTPSKTKEIVRKVRRQRLQFIYENLRHVVISLPPGFEAEPNPSEHMVYLPTKNSEVGFLIPLVRDDPEEHFVSEGRDAQQYAGSVAVGAGAIGAGSKNYAPGRKGVAQAIVARASAVRKRANVVAKASEPRAGVVPRNTIAFQKKVQNPEIKVVSPPKDEAKEDGSGKKPQPVAKANRLPIVNPRTRGRCSSGSG